MSLSPGSLAPAFDVVDAEGRRVSLEGGRGRYTLVSFHRFAACPLCNLAIRRFAQRSPDLLKRGLRIVMFFESGDHALKKALETWGPQQFSLVADPKADVYAAYEVPLSMWGMAKGIMRVGDLRESMKLGLPKGVPQDGSKSRVPAAYFIGPDLRVVEAYVGADVGDSVPVETVEDWLAQVERVVPQVRTQLQPVDSVG